MTYSKPYYSIGTGPGIKALYNPLYRATQPYPLDRAGVHSLLISFVQQRISWLTPNGALAP